ncbi:MAG: hypothetical protein ABSH06_29400 [Thermodesulfobacteriota bacterium]
MENNLTNITVSNYRKKLVDFALANPTFLGYLGHSESFRKLEPWTRWQIFKWRVHSFFSRVHDAYSVLMGRAEIAEED